MEMLPFIPMILYGIFILITIVIVIYLIVKRIQTRGKEDFEHRDN